MILYEIFNQTCSKLHKSTAVYYNQSVVRYRQIREQAIRISVTLTSMGVKPGDRIALIMRNTPEFIMAYFAILKIGAVAVPINFNLKAPEISYIMQDAGIVGAIVQDRYYETALLAAKNKNFFKFVLIHGDSPGSKQEKHIPCKNLRETLGAKTDPDENARTQYHKSKPDDCIMIIYTSGTTGNPKGVMLTNKNLVANIESCKKATDVNQKDCFICLLPMFHSFAWTVCVLLPISLGAKIAVIESIQPFRNVMKAVFTCKVTVFVGIPKIFSALARIPFVKPLHIFIPIRFCISGAAPLSPVILESFEKKFGIPLLEGYGLTETAPVVSLNPLNGKRKPGSIGIPIPGVTIKIVNDTGSSIPPGNQIGEICVKGDNVMKGYYNLPDATKASIDADGWFKTGDMGYYDNEGYVFIADRKKDIIISRGINIYPKEIENILDSHTAVSESSVIGISAPDGDETVVAYVTLHPDATVTPKELIQLCRKNIAAFKVPKEIKIIPEMPKNTLGKILKTELRKWSGKKSPITT
ncbi:MAG: long-chain-fatty-acid--CoA ligase [Elusimicrobia bacterium]|nr:long-chain-fatty-acid--CoA ligase [Elusimicrobiota bacterium]MBD3412506.1 long-chain-fatty-acid--CoA ligase [Elusimicrobiota bacterium]